MLARHIITAARARRLADNAASVSLSLDPVLEPMLIRDFGNWPRLISIRSFACLAFSQENHFQPFFKNFLALMGRFFPADELLLK
jgi:hypothetical protein